MKSFSKEMSLGSNIILNTVATASINYIKIRPLKCRVFSILHKEVEIVNLTVIFYWEAICGNVDRYHIFRRGIHSERELFADKWKRLDILG